MEAKLDQTQTEKNREKNREHFSLERIKKAGEQQQDFGDEQKHKSHQTKAACPLSALLYITEHRGDLTSHMIIAININDVFPVPLKHEILY